MREESTSTQQVGFFREQIKRADYGAFTAHMSDSHERERA